MFKNTAVRGRYLPHNTSKYIGDFHQITYRSMWERRFMLYCDRSDQINQWNSEEIHIPYISPKDDKWHNYYPDFFVRTCDGREMLVEIKPYYQRTWAVNQAKWRAAEEYCASLGWEFAVLTERDLF